MTTPVRYGEHVNAAPGTPCLLCGDPALPPRTDHCHEHGWVRGVLCSRCNTLMAFIDRRAAIRDAAIPESLSLAALVEHAARCPECAPFGVGDLGPTQRLGLYEPTATTVISPRVPAPLKSRLAAWARARGLTLNAAAIVLLDRVLSEDEKSSD